MKRIVSVLIVLSCGWVALAQQTPQDVKTPATQAAIVQSAAPLDEAERLLLENHVLRLRLMEQSFAAERAEITRRILAKRPGMEIDWAALTLKPKPADPAATPERK